MKIGDSIKICRLKNKLSQDELAEKTNVSRKTICNYEQNRSIPPVDVAGRIAVALGVSIDELLDIEESGFTKPQSLKMSMISSIQRYASLNVGTSISDKEITMISSYMKCSFSFLFGGSESQYIPIEKDNEERTMFDVKALSLIYDILDRCPGNDMFQILQIQISFIIIYHLEKTGTEKGLIKQKLLSSGLEHVKVNFLYEQLEKSDITKKLKGYGFNLSDLMRIGNKFNLSPIYLLTGKNINVEEK
jgi:transcriptional regulator with XRE-family HTH domain